MRRNRPCNLITRTRRALAAVLAVLALALAAPADAQTATQTGALTPEQEAAVQELIRTYLRENPEVLVEAIRALRAKQAQAEANRERDTLATRADEILNDPGSPVGGNPQGDVSLVEFFDYRCGYCKRVYPTVKRLIEQDGNIRFVFKEFPILGPQSDYAARAALASRSQGKYMEFHDKMMAARGELTQARVLGLAAEVGLDTDQLKRDMKAGEPEFAAIIAKNHQLARDLAITGTPAFIIGDAVVRGLRDLPTLEAMVVAARGAKKRE